MDNWMTPSENENLESPKMLSYEQHLLLLEGKSIHRSRNHILSHVPTTFSKSQFSKCSNTNKVETLYFSSHSTLEKMTLCFRWFLNPPPAPNLNLSVKNGKSDTVTTTESCSGEEWLQEIRKCQPHVIRSSFKINWSVMVWGVWRWGNLP